MLAEIRCFPTTLSGDHGNVHESVLRGYQIVQKVKELLRKGTPPETVLEIIEDLETAPPRERERRKDDV